MTADTVWTGVITLAGTVRVHDATLTIAPGAALVMSEGAELDIGTQGRPTAVRAMGTQAEPIVVCGARDAPGYWGSLRIGSGVTSDSVLSHVVVNGGGGRPETPASVVLEAPIVTDALTIGNSGSAGLYAAGFASGSRGLTIEGSRGAAVVLGHAAAVTSFPPESRILANGHDRVVLGFGEITGEVTFRPLPVPYLQEQSLQIWDGVVTFEAGVDYRVSANQILEIGWDGHDASIVASGQATNPVRFSGEEPRAGSWGGLLVRPNVSTDSLLRHVVLQHGGGMGLPALWLQAPIVIDHVSLGSTWKGVHIDASGLAAGSEALAVRAAVEAPMVVAPDALVTLPPGSQFAENAHPFIAVEAGDYTAVGTVANLGVPYRVLGPIDVLADAALSIAPGTTFLMEANALLNLGWHGGSASIEAEGTPQAPIRFEGLRPVAGYWRGIELGRGLLSTTRLRHVRISHAGGAGFGACLRALRPALIEDVHFTDCGGFGLTRPADDTTDYETSNVFVRTALGAIGAN